MPKNKYGNKRTEYNGTTYDSKREAEYARELDLLLHEVNGKLASWERQVPVPIIVNGKKICTIVVDFRETFKDGTRRYVEVKGHETKDWILKWKLFEAIYPALEKVIVR